MNKINIGKAFDKIHNKNTQQIKDTRELPQSQQ